MEKYLKRIKYGAFRGCKAFLYVGVPLMVWIILCAVSVLPINVAQIGCIALTPFVFLLGIPISIIMPIDTIGLKLGTPPHITLFIAVIVACINFVFIGILRGFFRKSESLKEEVSLKK